MTEAYMPLSKASRETGIPEAELRALCEGDSLDWHGFDVPPMGVYQDLTSPVVKYHVKSSDVARYLASRPAGTVLAGQK